MTARRISIPLPSSTLKPAPPDSKVEKWVRWIEGPISNEIMALHHRQAIQQRVAEIVNTREPKLPPSMYLDYLTETYATTQAAAVRRQAERSPRVISLGRLLDDVSENTSRLTRQRFVGPSEPEFQPLSHETFNKHFAGSGDTVDPEIVQRDIVQLDLAVKNVVDHVDQYIAHHDEKPVAELATFAELDEAIKVLGEQFRKYALLLAGADYVSLTPIPQHPWEAVFAQAWLVDWP